FYKPLYAVQMADMAPLEYETGGMALELETGYETGIILWRDSVRVFQGTAAEWTDALTLEAGVYDLQVHHHREKVRGEPYGDFWAEARFTVLPEPEPEPEPEPKAEPRFEAGRTSLQQGDVFTMRLWDLPGEVVPQAQTELGMSRFTPAGEGAWFAAVPVGNTRAPGDYAVTVQAGEAQWEAVVTVLPFEFDEQNLIIDVTDPQITEANSPAAYEEYRQKIPPLFETADDERYWDGVFEWPATGWISTTFGSIRYTNSDWDNPRFHWGMDIAAAEGSPVAAPANGRVVLAEYLLNTGNTIVIEHGGGLKSYYYHMFQLNVEAGDMVQKGDGLGQVGSTGYSTGAHLHFEIRIGNQAISPAMLFEADAGLYSLEEAPPS
ncbi:MAG: M23 family metallopeptidase, partial [Oscillospiraceae bacterium]